MFTAVLMKIRRRNRIEGDKGKDRDAYILYEGVSQFPRYLLRIRGWFIAEQFKKTIFTLPLTF